MRLLRRAAQVRPAALVAAGLCLFAVDASAQTGSAAARPGRQLFLWADGPQNAVAERYLRALCDVIGDDPEVRNRYSSIFVYRNAPGMLAAIQEMRASNPRVSPEVVSLAQLRTVMARDEYRCWVHPDATSMSEGSIELITLESLGPSSQGQLRSRFVSIGQGRQAAHPPEYLEGVDDVRLVAERLGRLYLALPIESVARATLHVSTVSSAQCRRSGGGSCAFLGDRLNLSVARHATVWLRDSDVNYVWEATCRRRRADGQEVFFAPDWERNSAGPTARVRINHTGSCRFTTTLHFRGGARVFESDIWHTQGGPILFSRMSVDHIETFASTTLREIPILPGIISTSNAERARSFLFGRLRVVDEQRGLALAQAIREAVASVDVVRDPVPRPASERGCPPGQSGCGAGRTADCADDPEREEPPDVERERLRRCWNDNDAMREASNGLLDWLGDTLAYEVVTGARFGRDARERAHPLCVQMWQRYEVGRRYFFGEQRRTWHTIEERWTSRCSAVIRELRDSVVREAPLPTRLQLSRFEASTGELYNAIPVLEQEQEPPPIVDPLQVELRMPTDSSSQSGFFNVQPLSGDDATGPGVPGQIQVGPHRPQAGLLFSFGATPRRETYGWTGDLGLSLYYMLLDEMLRLEYDVGFSVPLGSANGEPREDFLPSMKVAASVSFLRLFHYIDSLQNTDPIVFDINTTRDIPRTSIALNAGVGWNLPLQTPFVRLDLNWRVRPFSTWGFVLSLRAECPWETHAIDGISFSLGTGLSFL